MSTANKLTYLNDTKGLLKQKINNLGGDITDQTTFRQYAEELQTIYDNAPKTSYAEGSNITLSNTLKGKLDFENGIVGIGDTKQEGTPTPDNPQDIEVVRGKNRFDGELLPNSYNPTTGEIEASSTSYRSNKIPLQKNETYYLSGITGNVRVLYWNNTSYVSSEVITMPNSFITKGNIIAFQFDKSLSHENIMIEKGSQATSYLPYNTIEVVEKGINYCSNSSEIDGSIVNATTSVIAYASVKPNTKYTIALIKTRVAGVTIGNTGLWSVANITAYNGNTQLDTVKGHIIGGFSSGSVQIIDTYTTPSNCTRITVNPCNDNSDMNYNTKVTNIMILEGEYTEQTLPTYEPYQTPQTYQLSLGDKKLYDECYIVGSPDNWKFVDNFEKVRITGMPSTINTDKTNTTRVTFTNGMNNACLLSNEAKCNRLKYATIWNTDEEGFYNDNNSRMVIMRMNKLTIGTTNESVEAYLQSNETYVLGKLATPIETPITDETLISQLNAWYNAHSNNGTTIIEIDGQLPLIIKVRALKGE